MYRSRDYDEPTEACPKDAYRSQGHALNCMDLAAAKARFEHRPAPVRVYQCLDPSKGCFMHWHMTSRGA